MTERYYSREESTLVDELGERAFDRLVDVRQVKGQTVLDLGELTVYSANAA
jgi:hypothetical protein